MTIDSGIACEAGGKGKRIAGCMAVGHGEHGLRMMPSSPSLGRLLHFKPLLQLQQRGASTATISQLGSSTPWTWTNSFR